MVSMFKWSRLANFGNERVYSKIPSGWRLAFLRGSEGLEYFTAVALCDAHCARPGVHAETPPRRLAPLDPLVVGFVQVLRIFNKIRPLAPRHDLLNNPGNAGSGPLSTATPKIPPSGD